MTKKIAVLFARSDSIYKTFPLLDVYDIDRDARTYAGNLPVIAHPPCRAWGRLRKFAKPRRDERQLACFAIDTVRRVGGVLEHPASSSLWATCALPAPGSGFDDFGGWSIEVPQKWWGHKAEKNTWLYICGTSPSTIPVLPLVLGEASHTIGLRSGRARCRARPDLPKAEREETPPLFAAWLIELAVKCS